MSQQIRTPTRVTVRLNTWETVSKETGPAPSYAFHWPSVALAALAAATAITVYMMFVPRMLGVEAMDIGITIGQMADPSGGPVYLLTRIAWHVVHGLLYVPIYAAILYWFRIESSVRTGIAFGIFLWLAGPMTLIPLLLDRPRINAGDLSHPGVFMLALGLGWTPAIIDLGAHLIHGTLVGVICKHRRRAEPSLATAGESGWEAARAA
jgi:hypothetical protein